MEWISKIWNSKPVQGVAFVTVMFVGFGLFAELFIIGKCLYEMSLAPHDFWIEELRWNEVLTFWWVISVFAFFLSLAGLD